MQTRFLRDDRQVRQGNFNTSDATSLAVSGLGTPAIIPPDLIIRALSQAANLTWLRQYGSDLFTPVQARKL